jgi:hypothetical protein
MNMMWSFINNMQLIIHIPMLHLTLPGTTLYYIGKISEIMNYYLNPFKQILKKVIPYTPDNENNSDSVMTLLGYD